MKFLNLNDQEIDFLADAWSRADQAVQQRYGKPLEKNLAGIRLLQTLLDTDAEAISPHAYGVALGRVLVASISGLDWTIIEDEYGRDIVLRFDNTSLVVNVIGMINKRAKMREAIDLPALFESARQSVDRLRTKAER